jgi:hypothetical protein
MHTWDEIREQIKARNLASATWQSDQKSLLSIIDACSQLKLDPEPASCASISNLRTIIKQARRAIEKDDREHLTELLRWAAELPTAELRVRIGTHNLEEIPFWHKRNDGEEDAYLIEVNPKQLERIRRSTKSSYVFRKIEK